MRAANAPAFALASVLAACALGLGAASPAQASEGRTSSLSWLRMTGAESCIPTQALARAVEERLARRVFVSAAQADVSVEGRIEKIEKKDKADKSTWHAVITIRDAKGALLGTRELDRSDASCEAMNEPLALVIAVMIDPEAALKPAPAPAGTSPAEATPPAAAPEAPAPAPPPPPAEADAGYGPRPKAKEPWRAEGTAVFTMLNGIAPDLAVGGGVEGVLFVPGLPLGFRATANVFVPSTAVRDGARASFDLLYVGSAVCPTLRKPSIVAMICVGGQLGVLRSNADTPGRGIEEKGLVVWNGTTEARVSIPVFAPVEVTANLGAVLPLVRPAFGVANPSAPGTTENIHKVSVFGFSASVGAGFYFP